MFSKTLEEDFERIANSQLPFEKYRNQTFLVTGATGYIGSVLVKILLYLNERHGLGLKVMGMVRNREKAAAVFQDYSKERALSLIVQDMNKTFEEVEGCVDYIVHTAAVTASKEMAAFPVELIRTSIDGTSSVLELARKKASKGVVYLSSMEVYGTMGDTGHKVTEDELGTIDISLVRSGYPEGKRLCECLCNAYVKEYGLRIIKARLAQTFGAGILPGESRVFAQIARSVIRGEDIILHTAGMSEGNYVYIADALKALLLLLTEGANGEAYNVANEDCHTTILQMARMAAEEISGHAVKVVVDIPDHVKEMGYAPDVKLFLSSAKLQALGWEPESGLLESYRRMIRYMEETGIGI